MSENPTDTAPASVPAAEVVKAAPEITTAAPEVPAYPFADLPPASPKARTAKPAGKRVEAVLYRSRDMESINISLLGVRPLRNPEFPGRHEWRVPKDLEAKVDGHFHVRTGRIQKVTG